VAKPELARAWRKHLDETNPLADYPTCRLLQLMLHEEESMITWGEQAIAALARSASDAQLAQAWETHLRAFLCAAGGVAGDLSADTETPRPSPRSDGTPYVMDVIPQRDQRFIDPFNMSAQIDNYYRDEQRPFDERIYALMYKRLREMDVPEWMAPIIYQTKGKPWDYTVDISRQLWDEARHAMMGEVALQRDGLAFYTYPISIAGSMVSNTDFTPLEAHLILWGIEQSLMSSETGKRYERDIAQMGGDALASLFQDYDWADEVLHTQIGRKWLVSEFGSRANLQAAVQLLWERGEKSMDKLRSLSQQEEWWLTFLEDIRRRRQERNHRSHAIEEPSHDVTST